MTNVLVGKFRPEGPFLLILITGGEKGKFHEIQDDARYPLDKDQSNNYGLKRDQHGPLKTPFIQKYRNIIDSVNYDIFFLV